MDITAGCEVHCVPRELPEAALMGGAIERQIVGQMCVVYKLEVTEPSSDPGVKFLF